MNPSIYHRNLEYETKALLRTQFISHRTAIDNYEMPDWIEYDRMFYKFGKEVCSYKVKFEGERGLRDYLNTSTLDY